jgi:hypothetical protein
VGLCLSLPGGKTVTVTKDCIVQDVGAGCVQAQIVRYSRPGCSNGHPIESGYKAWCLSYYPVYSFLSNSHYREFAVHHPKALERRVVIGLAMFLGFVSPSMRGK